MIDRTDAKAFLAPASPKKIKDFEIFENDGTTPYDFNAALPSDENFLILAEYSGSYVWFIWDNGAVEETWYGPPSAGVTYEVVGVIQIWKGDTTDIDMMNTDDQTDSPLRGTRTFNNVDNEIVKL